MHQSVNHRGRILIVDDTPVNLEIAGKTLEKENYDLYIADSGPTALDLIEKIDFDLILMDIMMPEMDGFETFQQIRRNEKHKNIPVIFLSAKVDIEDVIKGLEMGGVDYIRKPFNELELKARVQTHVELKKTREELEQKNKSLRLAYKKIEIAATTDPLTKLINRREMIKFMDYEKKKYHRNKQSFSIIIGDVDFFKRINDSYGHNVGDSVLIKVAEILKSTVRKQDSVCRWGGEEFMLLLPGTLGDGAVELAEKLRRKIENYFFLYDGAEIKVTITFGISVYEGSMDLDELISQADTALYQAKQNGRNLVMIHPLDF